MTEDSYLKQWTELKEGSGIENASFISIKLFITGAFLSILVALLIFFQVHSAFVAIVSVAIGWVIAERNALLSKIALWPKLEKYLNWELIYEHVSK
ncbi:MAG: hypothetical protein P1U47_04940 [Zhongshania sp.]|uniref:hypothetical protein n=1 Tax=Zhongshania sp. TaxID=1971902 RepID=UPI0026145CAC|nr:hypothetical protein [Zhongshania sp.]MDF1691692.1 hypothetical protein [Zhongshania sp.]